MSMPASHVLLVDPDSAHADGLQRALEARGIDVEIVADRADALAWLERRAPDLVLIDADLPGDGGLSLLREARGRFPDLAVALHSGDGDVTRAVEAIRAGAVDYLLRPVDAEAALRVLGAAVAAAEQDAAHPPMAAGLIGESRAMQRVHELVRKAAGGVATVLLRGESGTGKELVARALHAASPRAAGPFVKIHCAALPDSLLESELFGYEKGAFTGATQRKLGRVELARGGTLFLDEIGDVTPATQVKLLRLLQDRCFERLGGGAEIAADVRIVTATHRDLESMIGQGTFREDLFYRFNVITIWLPPLRARRDDVALLARHFVESLARDNAKPELTLESEAVEHLAAQRWPGNVRQLRNLIERLVVLGDGRSITLEQTRRELSQSTQFVTQATGGLIESLTGSRGISEPVIPLSEELRAAERRAITRALEHTKGNRTLAARLLGVSRATLYNKLDEHGLS
jgi:two-component system, NtrC family, response regulator AtoC